MADEPKVETISARIAGRYLVQAPADAEPTSVLVGFHGYGESAEHHLQQLRMISGVDRWLLVSIQALNRFYDRRTGAVVASWMTSQGREQMIADNLAYVDSVVTHVLRTYSSASVIVYSGFSQGVAMAYRAAIRGRHLASGVIALAGDVPPDLHALVSDRWPRVVLGRGNNDPYYSEEAMKLDLAILERQGALVEPVVFDGAHEWHDDVRAASSRLLQAVG